MKIPYGIADFMTLRDREQLYVDRTDRIPALEQLGEPLLFLRPRRFGKSLWLSTLAAYYDLRTAEQHEKLFAGLAMGENPTPLAHRFFVLTWDFSEIDPDPPKRAVNAGAATRSQRVASALHGYLNTAIETFLLDYEGHLPRSISLGEDALLNLDRLLAVIRQTPYRLYLLIDEYDNFANEVMATDQAAYLDLVRSAGPFKHLFKWVKAAMGRKGIDRFFITGVSPIVMSDITSGMNIAANVYLDAELNTLCGFTDQEVRELLEQLRIEKFNEVGETAAAWAKPSWNVEAAHGMLRDWYNGYRFAVGAEDAVYNPTLVLYFLKHLLRTDAYPPQMLDANLAADEGKLDYIAQVASGQDAVFDLMRKEEPLEIRSLLDRFTFRDMLEPSAQDASFLGSFLFYSGMLTLKKEATPERTVMLAVPNEAIRGLYSQQHTRFE